MEAIRKGNRVCLAKHYGRRYNHIIEGKRGKKENIFDETTLLVSMVEFELNGHAKLYSYIPSVALQVFGITNTVI